MNYSDPNFDPRLRDPTLTWDGITWLKTVTNLPIIVKGILHPEDAILAVKQGVKGDCFFRIILSYRASHSKVCKVNCIFSCLNVISGINFLQCFFVFVKIVYFHRPPGIYVC